MRTLSNPTTTSEDLVEAALCGDVTILTRANLTRYEAHQFFFQGDDADTLMKRVIARGHLMVLQWYDQAFGNHVWTEDEWRIPAAEGHLALCKWLYAQTMQQDNAVYVMCRAAACVGHVSGELDLGGEFRMGTGLKLHVAEVVVYRGAAWPC